MTKLLEIERKQQLADDKILLLRLQKFNFNLHSEMREIDTYYSRPDVDFMKTVECLRIREREGFCEITYKPATTAETHTSKKRHCQTRDKPSDSTERCRDRQAASSESWHGEISGSKQTPPCISGE